MRLTDKKGQVDIVRLLLVVLVLAFLGLLPVWPYSHAWGFWPGSVAGVFLLVVILRVLGII